jgi:hypothetical protein
LGPFSRIRGNDITLTTSEFGPDDVETATALNNLALSYNKLARYTEAEPLYRRAIEIGEKTLGKDHPTVGGGGRSGGQVTNGNMDGAAVGGSTPHCPRATVFQGRSEAPGFVNVPIRPISTPVVFGQTSPKSSGSGRTCWKLKPCSIG